MFLNANIGSKHSVYPCAVSFSWSVNSQKKRLFSWHGICKNIGLFNVATLYATLLNKPILLIDFAAYCLFPKFLRVFLSSNLVTYCNTSYIGIYLLTYATMPYCILLRHTHVHLSILLYPLYHKPRVIYHKSPLKRRSNPALV